MNPRRVLAAFAVAVTCALVTAGGSAASPGLTTQNLTSGLTATDLVNTLLGSGIAPMNVTFAGTSVAAGKFISDDSAIIGFKEGIILSSGSVENVVGPNVSDGITGVNGTPGDNDLTSLVGRSTFDAAILEFDFVPSASDVSFKYVFASDEYNEFVNSQFNDVFAFFIGGTNCATVPESNPPEPVAINTINGGNPFGTNASHPELYRNNDLSDGGGAINTEMDGLTVVLTCSATVTPGVLTHVKLAIADTSDSNLDSNVFLEKGSFVEEHETTTTYTGPASGQYSDPVTLSGTLLDATASPSAAVAGQNLLFQLGSQSASAGPTDATGSASTSLVLNQLPGTYSVQTSFAGASGLKPSSDDDPFTIFKEDCTLTYSGDTLVPPATMTNLAAELGEPDAVLGDLSNKSVTFTVVDAALNTQTFSTATDTSGHASISAALPDGVYGVSASFSGDDFYLPCATVTETIVTVQAAAAKVTGGGWIAIGTGRTSFGFNAIPQAGTLFTGQFQLRSHNGKNRFHGNVVSSLTSSADTATWTGTGSWNGQSGHTYTISVVDNGSSGSRKDDTISITITSPTSGTVYTTEGAQTLKGGNITVH